MTRFRQGPVAMMADIEAMFHQVRVQPEDCDALRFLWWPDNDLNCEPEEYQMMVHLFGGVSSPSCANLALQRTADDNAKEFGPEIVKSVKRNFYVDDCLKSNENEQFLMQRNVKWIFNTPKASHHGGVWERCIRTVRKVLNAITKEQVLDDKRLYTLMCEVEAIVNSRPITKVSDDPKDVSKVSVERLLETVEHVEGEGSTK